MDSDRSRRRTGRAAPKRPIALVVDADRATREAIRRIVVEAGLDCEVATNGVEALDRAGRSRPALVVLDLMLPKLSGLAVADVLRARHGPTLPVLLLSANAGMLDAARRRPEGFVCLDKPFALGDVELAIQQLLADGRWPEPAPGRVSAAAGVDHRQRSAGTQAERRPAGGSPAGPTEPIAASA